MWSYLVDKHLILHKKALIYLVLIAVCMYINRKYMLTGPLNKRFALCVQTEYYCHFRYERFNLILSNERGQFSEVLIYSFRDFTLKKLKLFFSKILALFILA